MSTLLKRALKISLVPAIIMVAGKALGIFVISAIHNFPIEVGNDISGFFSTQIYFQDEVVTYFVNSLSDFTMLISLAVPTIYLITKTALFQSTLQNPKTIVKVTKFNMLKWITRDDTTFLMIFVWSAFLWLTAAIVIKNVLLDRTYSWIGIVAGILVLFVGLGALKTFEVQVNKVYPNSNKYY
ncbi:hypothetical protein GX888_00255 [Candidatus Dojkabacteria bacterium]|uniref:Uncharacterized protein n=1 Tax=Candidatus Dojkabacteria bacterium TaxID=2099670 RepID=A0A847VCH1_9BACT|nr:hypothetical protein [Candidatus Dojkabacteria bacterium]